MKPTDRTSGLTQERLQALLCYDPITGVFAWRVSRPNGVLPGDVAGSVDSSKGYLVIKIDGRRFIASRLAWLYMTGRWPVALVDHEDCNKLNYRWSNLRAAWRCQNGQNMPLRGDSTTGFKGVSFDRARGKFSANIRVASRLRFLGRFLTAEDAHAAYCKAAVLHFGPYARSA